MKSFEPNICYPVHGLWSYDITFKAYVSNIASFVIMLPYTWKNNGVRVWRKYACGPAIHNITCFNIRYIFNSTNLWNIRLHTKSHYSQSDDSSSRLESFEILSRFLPTSLIQMPTYHMKIWWRICLFSWSYVVPNHSNNYLLHTNCFILIHPKSNVI